MTTEDEDFLLRHDVLGDEPPAPSSSGVVGFVKTHWVLLAIAGLAALELTSSKEES